MPPSRSDRYRDAEPPDEPVESSDRHGRKVVAVVGINDYAAWPRLYNAVSDARGALALFTRLGFELAAAPLLDRTATGEALRRLVTDDLARLSPEDSLVLFFAGHGFTRTHELSNAVVKTGYLIPADGDAPTGLAARWVRLDSWLSDIARLPARHILVILDACHSGVALDAVVTWRGLDGGAAPAEPLAHLRARQSRRVITSALEDQRALDNGPMPGHSLFTGCLIEALTGGLAREGRREATGSELAQYVQRRVTTFPGSAQTPDFGALELDDRGELVLPLVVDPHPPVPALPPPPPERPRHRRRALLAGTAGLALLVAAFWAAPGGGGNAPVPGESVPDAPVPDAPVRDAPPPPADAALVPDSPPPDPRRPRCWVPRDDVYALPRPCNARCPAGCIDARSEDAPVAVPEDAFKTCREIWICEPAFR